MTSVMQKPPLAPKPKLSQYQRPVLSPTLPRKNGLSQPSPGTKRRVKPVLAPKPCLSKLTTAVEPKPLNSKSLHPSSVLDPPRTTCLLNSQNGLQQENKKPDWDYVIPICLCSQESCMCNPSTNIEKKLVKTIHNDKTEDKGNSPPVSPGSLDDNINKMDKVKPLVKNPLFSNDNLRNTKIPHKTPLNNTPNTDVDTASPVRVFPLQKQGSSQAIANPISNGVTDRGMEEDDLGSEQTIVPQPKLVPVTPTKPIPVPRKPKAAIPAHQEKVEEQREEIVSQEESKITVTEAKVSSEGKGSSSLSVSVPASENNQPVILSTRRASAPPAPPAPPPRKKPYLSKPENTPAFSPQTNPQDVMEEDLGWDSGSYGMEVSVDEDDEMQKERMDDQKAADDILTHRSPSGVSPRTPTAVPVASFENWMDKAIPKKPQRHSNPLPLSHKMESSMEELGNSGDSGKNNACPVLDGAMKEKIVKELPLPPHAKSSKHVLTPGIVKPSRSSLNKQKARSFSAADFTLSDGQRRNSFRKLLDLKLSVPKMLPKLMTKGSQSPDYTDNRQSVNKDQDGGYNFHGNLRVERKLSCPLIMTVEQNVDRDEFYPGLEEDCYYENISYYEEIPDYMNVQVGNSSPLASCLQPEPWLGSMYNDEGIYEEQEPYISLVKNVDQDLYLTPTDCNKRDLVNENVNDIPSDDDIEINSSDEEDEGDSSSFSSKGEPEPQAETTTQSEKKNNKIHHIATEIMTSESVFVDVLKLLHVDFRDSVAQASRQSGKPVIEERILNQILYSLPQLYELNQDLLRELKQRVAKWDENAQLADIFLKKGPYLKMYSTYIREFDKNVALLEEQSKRNPAFGAVVRTFEASPRCANLALKHYLLKPIQRIPQYQLLLTDYLKNLSEDSSDYKDTQAALATVKEVANHANDIMKQGDNFQKLIQVQCRLNGSHVIVQPGRIFLKEGSLKKLARKVMQPRMFFLFNDTLLYTTPVQSGQYKLNNMLSLAGMKVSKPSQEAYQNELNIESVERSFILSASSAAERDEWLEAISTAISEYTKKKISFISGKPIHEVEEANGNDGFPLGSKAPIWIPDLRTTMCMICTCDFTLTWRRHHCRACGKVVCQACSSNKHCLEYLKNQLARVCDQCFVTLQEQKSEMTSPITASPGNRATFFNRKHKKIPAALKEVTANTDNSSMSGYLQRFKGNKRQGKRLWFVIKDKVLYTYAASEDVAALESQPLLGFMLKPESSQKLQFKLYHKNTLYYNFKADDIQTAQRWIDSFKEATVL